MKNSILTELYQSREMTDLINKMQPEHLREEIKQELFLTLCEMDEQRLIGLHLSGQLKFYVTRIVLNMVQSSSSPFFKKYRKIISVDLQGSTDYRARNSDIVSGDVYFSMKLAAPDDEEAVMEFEMKHNALLEEVEKVLGDMHWYTKELFKLYVHHGSAGKVIKAMKNDLGGRYIPRRTILDVVKKAKTEIRAKVDPAKVIPMHRENQKDIA